MKNLFKVMLVVAMAAMVSCGGNASKKADPFQENLDKYKEIVKAVEDGDYEKVTKLSEELDEWMETLSEEELMKFTNLMMDGADEAIDAVGEAYEEALDEYGDDFEDAYNAGMDAAEEAYDAAMDEYEEAYGAAMDEYEEAMEAAIDEYEDALDAMEDLDW